MLIGQNYDIAYKGFSHLATREDQELRVMKEKLDATQETRIVNRTLNNQTTQGLATLDGCVEVLERQGSFLLDSQEQDSNGWHNVTYNLCEEVEEAKRETTVIKDLLNVQRRSNQQLCASFNEAHWEMMEALKEAHRERKWKQMMKRELDELRGQFIKLKEMVHIAFAAVNIQNDDFPTVHIVDIFGPQMVGDPTESKSIVEGFPVGACCYRIVYSAIGVFSSITTFAC